MKKVLMLIGLVQDEPQPKKTIKETKFTSTYPEDRPSLHEWCKEFRFGMLYDRRAIYMN